MPIAQCPLCGRVDPVSLWTGCCGICEAKETPEQTEARLYRDSRAGLIRPGSLCYRPRGKERTDAGPEERER